MRDPKKFLCSVCKNMKPESQKVDTTKKPVCIPCIDRFLGKITSA